MIVSFSEKLAGVRTPPAPRRASVAVGLAGGAQVRGWLQLPPTWQVSDLLNNVREPLVNLEGEPDAAAGSSSVILTRSSIAWICALEGESAGAATQEISGPMIDRPVVVHVGPFEVRGTLATHPNVDWSNLLIGRAGPPAEFLSIGNAQVVGCDGLPVLTVSTAVVAVNVGLIAALLS